MTVAQVGATGIAPPGLKPGDNVNTAGGLVSIVRPGTPGSTYNPASGYSSIRVTGRWDNPGEQFAYAQAESDRNSALSQQFAREQMQFQEQSNAKAMQFSAEQAEINRAFQERMSNTAHQRETKDLIAAGLNPILSANGGASAPGGSSASGGVSSSGASGQVDTSSQQILGGLMQAIIGQATALQTTSQNNMTAMQMAMVNQKTAFGTANINARSNQFINAQNFEFDKWMKQNYPQTQYGAIAALLTDIRKFIDNSPYSGNDKAKYSGYLGDILENFMQKGLFGMNPPYSPKDFMKND